MNLSRESLKLWLSAVLTNNGAYGSTPDRPARFEPDRDPRHASRPKQTQRLSCVIATGRLTVGRDGPDVRLTVKLKPPVEQLRTVLKSDRQFHNEIHAYTNVIPFLVEHLPDGARAPSMPAYVYGRNEGGPAQWPEDAVVLEDPRASGYVAARAQSDPHGAHHHRHHHHMDYAHLAVAIAALGRFHGMSYTAKQKNPVAFRKLVGNLREIQWDEDGWLVKNNGLKSLSMRGARPLMEREQYAGGRLKGFLTMIREADRNLKLAMTPKEPFAVICHGDYCKPNIMFDYDEAGEPRDAMITEFTAVRYGSPGLDLSYFLYKNADEDVQNNRWSELLAVYLEALSAVLPTDVKPPTMDQLHRELRFHALYGYAHLLFAVPNMINENPRALLEAGDDDANVTVEELLVNRLDAADEKITDILSATVRHIIDHGYAEQYEYSSNSR